MTSKEKNNKDNDLYGDGDQSPMKGTNAERMRRQWCSGMDFHPDNLGEFYKACLVGHTPYVQTKLDETSNKTKLLEKRETKMRFTALFCVVSGAKMLVSSVHPTENNRLETLKLLIKAGANVNAKDVAGYSVLFHCFSGHGDKKEKLAFAKQLVHAGADVNLQNRFGSTALHENVLSRNFKFLQVLIDYGADPNIKCNDGNTPNSLASSLPKAQNIFSQRTCGYCEKVMEGHKRCTRFWKVYYCDRECQKADWKKHKQTCQPKTRHILRVDPRFCFPDKNLPTFPKGKTFVVKVQVSLGDNSCLVYDEKRSFQYLIDHGSVCYSFINKIKAEGLLGGLKAYFKACFDDERFLCVDIDKMVEAQPW